MSLSFQHSHCSYYVYTKQHLRPNPILQTPRKDGERKTLVLTLHAEKSIPDLVRINSIIGSAVMHGRFSIRDVAGNDVLLFILLYLCIASQI
jgi:hypothetical protein